MKITLKKKDKQEKSSGKREFAEANQCRGEDPLSTETQVNMRAVRGVRGRELDLSRAALVREWRVHDLSEEAGQTRRERHPMLHASDRRRRCLLAQAQNHASRSHAF